MKNVTASARPGHWSHAPEAAETHRLACPHERRELASARLERERRELQGLVARAAAAGLGRRELAGMPAFRQAIARCRAFAGERNLARELIGLPAH
jgi:hypothetical protein